MSTPFERLSAKYADLQQRYEDIVQERDDLLAEVGVQSNREEEQLLMTNLSATPHEAWLIIALFRANGRVLSPWEIEENMPSTDRNHDRGIKIVDVYVCRARKLLGHDAIQTSWGRGYRMNEVGEERVRAALKGKLPIQTLPRTQKYAGAATRILSAVGANEGASTIELAEATGYPRSYVITTLCKLRDRDKLARCQMAHPLGRRPYNEWFLTPAGRKALPATAPAEGEPDLQQMTGEELRRGAAHIAGILAHREGEAAAAKVYANISDRLLHKPREVAA